ncbi:hypothetical protein L596_021125 [Steinernema carpocapsae]|uniref:Core-2/I-Branching enzyme n=1 Tax=Steinernema carpocapsae TaxID=34508 RepID=A0A4U5MWD8_STECR|nr:hypothetical protein L596_021125 [Steinernema carpocapsae]
MTSVDLANVESYNHTLENLMKTLQNYRENVKCDEIVKHEAKGPALIDAHKWTFNYRKFENSFFRGKEDMCESIKSTFGFLDKPLSQEENEYPLAYGMLVHTNPIQILFLLSAVYQPQNQFCIAVDGKASDRFKKQMFYLSECFPNIFVMVTGKVFWCEHSVLQGVFGCVQYLAKLKADWKYYQYLSGVDLPLKTNLEMVRIFKKLNGSFNAGIHDLPKERYKHGKDPPIPLWKSSLSATFSRESAEFMVSDPKVWQVYKYLKGTLCPDESFWATIAGNADLISMPGGFNATSWREHLTGEYRPVDTVTGVHEASTASTLFTTEFPETVLPNPVPKKTEAVQYDLFKPEKYYISRYQVWYNRSSPDAINSCYGVLSLNPT